MSIWRYTQILRQGEGGAGGGGPLAGAGAGGGEPGAAAGGGDPGAGQGGGQAWTAFLPEDMRQHPEIARYADDLPGLAKDYLNKNALVGKKGVIPPGDKATETDWDAFYKQLGRPDDAIAYTFKPAQEGAEFDDMSLRFHDGMRPFLHRAGLTQRQLDIVNEGFNKAGVDINGEIEKQAAAGEATLRQKYGDYDKRMAAIGQMVENFGGQNAAQLRDVVMKGDLRHNEGLFGLFSRLADALTEDGGGMRGLPGGFDAMTSPQAARAELEKIRSAAQSDSKHPYNNYHTAEGKALAERVMRLEEVASRGR